MRESVARGNVMAAAAMILGVSSLMMHYQAYTETQMGPARHTMRCGSEKPKPNTDGENWGIIKENGAKMGDEFCNASTWAGW